MTQGLDGAAGRDLRGGPAPVQVRLPGVLAEEAGGARTIAVPVPTGGTLADLLAVLGREHPRLHRRLLDESGVLRPHVNVFVGGDEVRSLLGLDTAVAAGSEVLILPSIAGG